MSDSGPAWAGTLAPGSTGTLENSHCTANGKGSSASGSGQTLNLNLWLSVAATFVGNQQLHMVAQDSERTKSGWQQRRRGTRGWIPGQGKRQNLLKSRRAWTASPELHLL
jgi:hypothetical protein